MANRCLHGGLLQDQDKPTHSVCLGRPPAHGRMPSCWVIFSCCVLHFTVVSPFQAPEARPLLKEPADDALPTLDAALVTGSSGPSFLPRLPAVICRGPGLSHPSQHLPHHWTDLLSHQRGPQPSLGRDPTSGHWGTVTRPGREKLYMWVPTAHSHASIHIRGQRGVSWTSRLQA